MPVWTEQHVSFNRGYLGPYMRGRRDLKEYISGAMDLTNQIVLPHGGCLRRRGLGNIYEFANVNPADFQYAMIFTFSFSRDQQYCLAFMPDNLIYIFRNRELKATLPHTYKKEDIRTVKWSQQLDSVILTHPSYPPKKLARAGRDTAWIIGDIVFINYPFFRWNNSQTLAASATTGAITLTVSGSTAYFRAGYAGGVQIKPQPGLPTATAEGLCITNGFPTDSTGGTALSSAGTAASAFDLNPATLCNCGVNGWAGYSWGATPHRVRVVGINANTSATVDLVFETDDNDTFTSPTVVGTQSGVALVAGFYIWLDVPPNTGDTRFRVRVTNGATLDLKDVVFAFGLRATAAVSVTLNRTAASKTWREQLFSPGHGWPICRTFFSDRLYFAGVRDVPNVITASNVSDYFNFDDSVTNDSNTFTFLANSDDNQTIYNLKPNRKGLVALASDGEFSLEATADGGVISPTKPMIAYQQSSIGSADIPLLEVDGQILFISNDRKEVVSFQYDFGTDQYLDTSLTIYAHDIFVDLLQRNSRPRRLALLPNYRDTQSSILMAPCDDGNMACLTYDARSRVRAWRNFATPNGSFLDVTIVHSLIDDEIGVVGEATFLISRTIDGESRLFLEFLASQDDVWLDHWERASNETPSTGPFTFTEGLPNTNITVTTQDENGIAVMGDYTTAADGTFRTLTPVITPYAGIKYFSRLESMPVAVELASASLKGRPCSLREAIITFDGSMDGTCNGRPIYFRNFDSDLFDTSIPLKRAEVRVSIDNLNGETLAPTVVVETDQPVPCNVLNLTIKYKCGQS